MHVRAFPNGTPFPENFVRGERARLIPVTKVAEERATSVFLACLMSIEEFAQAMFGSIGIKLGKRYYLDCYTEVNFKGDDPKKDRPDGLVILNTGMTTRYYLVETKTKKEDLDEDQVVRYIDLARRLGFDGVITISNQFTAVPTHHPVRVPGNKLGKMGLYHWSWSAIMTEANLLAGNETVSDRDQQYVLHEFLRFLSKDPDVVRPFSEMTSEWTEVCERVNMGQALRKTDNSSAGAVTSWHHLNRFLALQLGEKTGTAVQTVLRRGDGSDPKARLARDTSRLVDGTHLGVEYRIPDAAGDVEVLADLKARTLRVGMRIKAPQDVARPATAVKWLVRQLPKDGTDDMVVEATWPGRTPVSSALVSQVREDPSALLAGPNGSLPTSFYVARHMDLGARFRQRRKFVEAVMDAVPTFYGDVGQHLRAWVPTAPKLRSRSLDLAEEDVVDRTSPDAEEGPAEGTLLPASG